VLAFVGFHIRFTSDQSKLTLHTSHNGKTVSSISSTFPISQFGHSHLISLSSFIAFPPSRCLEPSEPRRNSLEKFRE
jgi:hypothetical protein